MDLRENETHYFSLPPKIQADDDRLFGKVLLVSILGLPYENPI